jgi:putative zinc finger/helix-turn-helix YgiT family protein
MNCHQCGHKMTRHYEDTHFPESGLDNVWLTNAFHWRCECGEDALELKPVPSILDAITRAVLAKPAPLTGQEIRYLRKAAGLKSKELAEILAVDMITMSKWEREMQPIKSSHERAIRLVVAGLLDLDAGALIRETFPRITPGAELPPQKIVIDQANLFGQ